MFEAYKWLKNYNMLPGPGTWMDQAARFIKAVDLCDHVGGFIGRRKREIQAKDAELKAKIGGLHA